MWGGKIVFYLIIAQIQILFKVDIMTYLTRKP